MSQDDHSTQERGDHEVGTVGEEAAKLLGALSGWAHDHGSELGEGMAGLAGHAARSVHDVGEHIATGSAECAWCPVCRTVQVLRQTSPEVRADLATAATSLLKAAAGLLATAVPDDRAKPAGVEHIDLDGGPDDWPAEPDGTDAGETGPEEED